MIIGAGLYGLYAALYCGRLGMKVQVLETDEAPFCRATYINQARVHMGYHYPRSLSTALKSAGYFRRFNDDFGFCVHSAFDQVYATSAEFSWTDAREFVEFCRAAKIRCDEVPASKYFKPGVCDGAFLTEEYTYDAHILRDYFVDEIAKLPNVSVKYGVHITDINRDGDKYMVSATSMDSVSSVGTGVQMASSVALKDDVYEAPFVLNATYASVNQILAHIFPDEMFKIKYELCEIILCESSPKLKDIGLTVMDGPFFSIMPFGKTGLHSLTAVTFTPHVTSFDDVPKFKCMGGMSGDGSAASDIGSAASDRNSCSPEHLNNCSTCPNKPKSAWPYMSHLADKYMLPEYEYKYVKSLYSMKPILKSSEVDDSRPTAIRVHSTEPTFISVLSGKINTVYDLDEYLK